MGSVSASLAWAERTIHLLFRSQLPPRGSQAVLGFWVLFSSRVVLGVSSSADGPLIVKRRITNFRPATFATYAAFCYAHVAVYQANAISDGSSCAVGGLLLK